MAFLKFEDRSAQGRITKTWAVLNKDGLTLGFIIYRNTWRKYTFEPTNYTTFDVKCLEEIVQFLKDHAEDRQ